MDQVWTNIDNPETYPKVSVSELRSLLRCTKQHDYAYRQGLVPVSTAGYFVKGKYLHRLMQIDLDLERQGILADPGEVIGQARADIIAEHGTLAVGTTEFEEVDEQLRSYLRETDFNDTEILEVEREFYADIGLRFSDIRDGFTVAETPVLLHGVIDALVRVNGDLWLVEHKTAGRAWSQGQFAFDYQSKLYTAAVTALGLEAPAGTIFNFFYPKRWETKLVYTTSTEVDLLLEEIQKAVELRDGLGSPLVRQPHWGCNDCGFRALCHSELIGTDAGYIRSTEFTVDQDKVDRFTQED